MCERSIGVCLRALSWTEESWHNSKKKPGCTRTKTRIQTLLAFATDRKKSQRASSARRMRDGAISAPSRGSLTHTVSDQPLRREYQPRKAHTPIKLMVRMSRIASVSPRSPP